MYNTIWGTATLHNNGYYKIASSKEGNLGKYLHRLIWEKAWGKIPKDWVIHHLDGNKQNNCLLNLYGMPEHLHLSIHTKGKNNPFYGKVHSEETRKKLSEMNLGREGYWKGKSRTEEDMVKMSKSKNTSGYFRVRKMKKPRLKQGFLWRYTYYENGKQKDITCMTIDGLKEKVTSKGLKWIDYLNGGDVE